MPSTELEKRSSRMSCIAKADLTGIINLRCLEHRISCDRPSTRTIVLDTWSIVLLARVLAYLSNIFMGGF